MPKNNRIQLLIKLIFILYLIILFSVTLTPVAESIVSQTTYNLIPIVSIAEFFSNILKNGIINWKFLFTEPTNITEIMKNTFTNSFINLVGNILIFVPFGFLYSLSRKKRVNLPEAFLMSLSITVLIEIIQYFFFISRRADIDDVILNLIGGLIGYSLYLWMINENSLAFRLLNSKSSQPTTRQLSYQKSKIIDEEIEKELP